MIKGLKTTPIAGILGKNTDDNLTQMDSMYAINAKNVVFQGDGVTRKLPGYTKVQTLSGSGYSRIYDWQRDSDKAQFVLVQHASTLGAIKASGTVAEQVLSSSEDSTKPFDFVKNFFAAYANNGVNAYRFIDNAGTLTKYKWGITPPATAATLTTSAGSLTLKYGRQIVYCYVSKITDAQGNRRTHVSAPSPLTAHSGPQTSKVLTWSNIVASADPQVTHIWVFETVDTPLNTSSVFYFAAEITNGTTSWGDTLADSALDTTRLAPWDNFPAPLGSIVVTYQNRVGVIDPNTGFIYFSGFDEIDLGIPEESFPATLFFQIPSGIRKPTAAIVVDDGNTLLISTEEAWYKIQGYNADTLTRRDKVVSPGAVGKKAVALSPYGVAWVSRDKRLWAWLGTANPYQLPTAVPVSSKLQAKLQGTYAMDDLSDANLANTEVKWFTSGKHHYIMVLGNTSDQPTAGFNWIQLWFVDFDEGSIKSVGESDFIPTDLIGSAAVVQVGSTPYLFMGDSASGNLYRWPDGYTHNGASYRPVLRTAWNICGAEATKRFFWVDGVTDRADAVTSFALAAAVSDAPDSANVVAMDCPLQALPAGYGSDPEAFRASLQQPGTSMGRYLSLVIQFPDDNNPASLSKLLISALPMYATSP